MSVLEPRVTSNARLGFSIFFNPSYFCYCNFVSANKARLAVFPGTKLHKQKCYTFRDIENPSSRIIFSQWYRNQYSADLARRGASKLLKVTDTVTRLHGVFASSAATSILVIIIFNFSPRIRRFTHHGSHDPSIETRDDSPRGEFAENLVLSLHGSAWASARTLKMVLNAACCARAALARCM
jgi:hypothetical protein